MGFLLSSPIPPVALSFYSKGILTFFSFRGFFHKHAILFRRSNRGISQNGFKASKSPFFFKLFFFFFLHPILLALFSRFFPFPVSALMFKTLSGPLFSLFPTHSCPINVLTKPSPSSAHRILISILLACVFATKAKIRTKGNSTQNLFLCFSIYNWI